MKYILNEKKNFDHIESITVWLQEIEKVLADQLASIYTCEMIIKSNFKSQFLNESSSQFCTMNLTEKYNFFIYWNGFKLS